MNKQAETGGTVMNFGQAVKLLKFGAPLHPILVHFTIALVSASLLFDAVSFFFNVSSLLIVGWWTLALSFAVTVFTVATGVKSRINLPIAEGEARSFLRSHMALGLIFFGMLLAITIWRAAIWQANDNLSWWYLLAAGATAAAMSLQGYLGGELVYRYGTEVEGDFRHLPEENRKTNPPSLYPKSAATEEGEKGGAG